MGLTRPLPEIKEASGVIIKNAISVDEEVLASVLVHALQSHWDWWIKDLGGHDATEQMFTRLFKDPNEKKYWLVAEIESTIVGLTGYHLLDSEVASFAGVMVLPEYRGRGIGKMLLSSILRSCANHHVKKLQVFTVSRYSS